MKSITIAALVLGLLALIVLWPFVCIWALNTLFPTLAIDYTPWTWLAMFVVTATFAPKSVKKG